MRQNKEAKPQHGGADMGLVASQDTGIPPVFDAMSMVTTLLATGSGPDEIRKALTDPILEHGARCMAKALAGGGKSSAEILEAVTAFLDDSKKAWTILHEPGMPMADLGVKGMTAEEFELIFGKAENGDESVFDNWRESPGMVKGAVLWLQKIAEGSDWEFGNNAACMVGANRELFNEMVSECPSLHIKGNWIVGYGDIAMQTDEWKEQRNKGLLIEVLPHALRTDGTLDLSDCALWKSLPEKLAIGGDLWLKRCPGWDGIIPDTAKIAGLVYTDQYPHGVSFAKWRKNKTGSLKKDRSHAEILNKAGFKILNELPYREYDPEDRDNGYRRTTREGCYWRVEFIRIEEDCISPIYMHWMVDEDWWDSDPTFAPRSWPKNDLDGALAWLAREGVDSHEEDEEIGDGS